MEWDMEWALDDDRKLRQKLHARLIAARSAKEGQRRRCDGDGFGTGDLERERKRRKGGIVRVEIDNDGTEQERKAGHGGGSVDGDASGGGGGGGSALDDGEGVNRSLSVAGNNWKDERSGREHELSFTANPGVGGEHEHRPSGSWPIQRPWEWGDESGQRVADAVVLWGEVVRGWGAYRRWLKLMLSHCAALQLSVMQERSR